MELTGVITTGFTPFRDGKEHTLEPCQHCGATIKATKVNGPAVGSDRITGAFFLNAWLCRQCYEALQIKDGEVLFKRAETAT